MLAAYDNNKLIVEKKKYKVISRIYQFIIIGAVITAAYSLIWGGNSIKVGIDVALNRIIDAVMSFTSGSKGFREISNFLKMVREPFLFYFLTYIGFIVHRLLHAFGYRVFGRLPAHSVEIRFNPKTVIPVGILKCPIKISSHKWAVMLPGIVLGLMPIFAGLAVGFFLPVLWGVIQLTVSFPDYVLILKICSQTARSITGAASIISHPSKEGNFIVLWAGEDSKKESGAVCKASGGNDEKSGKSGNYGNSGRPGLDSLWPTVIVCVTIILTVLMYIPFGAGVNGIAAVSSPAGEDGEPGIGINGAGNLSNGGNVSVSGEWIFFKNTRDSDKLYKMKSDGTSKSLVIDDTPLYINVVGDWIYYCNTKRNYGLYKVRTDGSERTLLEKGVSESIQIVGEWIYFSLKGKLHRIKTDGSGKTRLSEDELVYKAIWEDVPRLAVSGEWIYYRNVSDGGKLYKIRIDGSGRVRLDNHQASFINISGNWIYYVNKDYNIYRMKPDGTSKTLLAGGNIEGINVDGDWIYYINIFEGDKIYKIKTDGTGHTKLADIAAGDIQLAGGRIYFTNLDDNGYIYSMGTDGGKPELVR